MFKYVINKKYVQMMEYIKYKKPNMREISKKTRINYLVVRKILIEFEKEGLIEPVFNVQKPNRDHKIVFTGAGIMVFKLLQDIAMITREAI